MKEVIIKRICEKNWHKEIALEKFKICPICRSKAVHLAICKYEMESKDKPILKKFIRKPVRKL